MTAADTDRMHAHLVQWHRDGALVRFGPNWGAWKLNTVEQCHGDRDCTPMERYGECAGIISVTNVGRPEWSLHGHHVYDELGAA